VLRVSVKTLCGLDFRFCIRRGHSIERHDRTGVYRSRQGRDRDADAQYQIDHSRPTQLIDGITFRHTLDEGAAMGHEIQFNRYWGFDKGKCFELAVAVTYTNFAAYDPGQIKEFTTSDQAKVTSELNKIVTSFQALK
jgi:hypothetical protein